MTAMSLSAVLSAHRDEILRRWQSLVRGKVAPDTMPTVELMDQLPVFLDDVIGLLGAPGRPVEPGRPTPDRSTAAEHGHQRLRLGFSLDAVVREYAALADAVLDTAEDAGAPVSFRQGQILFNAIIGGIAHAVCEYARQRDAQLQRQHNEHFAFIAHELRNPLSSARLAVDQLKRKQALADGQAAQVLERSLEQMQELIDHTLDVARVASGIELRAAPVRLGTLFDEVRLAVACDVEAKGVDVRAHIEADAEVVVDERLARSALTNLVRNAIKYTAPGSAVELSGAVVGRQLHIEVADHCGGLPPGRVEQVFAPFVRLSSKESGFGLGLAIAKQAVDAHGGALRVQNVPGKGCIFVIDLPSAPG